MDWLQIYSRLNIFRIKVNMFASSDDKSQCSRSQCQSCHPDAPRLDVNNKKVCTKHEAEWEMLIAVCPFFGWFFFVCVMGWGQKSSVNRPFSLFDWVSPQVRRNAFSRAMMTIIGYLHFTKMDKVLKMSPLKSDSSVQMKIKPARVFQAMN